MKKYLVILILFPCISFGQTRKKERVSGSFTVSYSYSDTIAFVKWQPEGKRVYHKAKITVLKNGVKVRTIDGYYCPDTDALLDNKENWINTAKNINQ